MFFNTFEDRIQLWRNFRQELEVHPDPLIAVIEFWNRAPIGARICDPYDRDSWPDPWELIQENNYCEFGKILAMYYTLALTDRFQNEKFQLCICLDRSRQHLYYMLYSGDIVIGYHYDQIIDKKNLPTTLNFLANYILIPSEYH